MNAGESLRGGSHWGQRDRHYFVDWANPETHQSLLADQAFQPFQAATNPELGIGVATNVWGDHLTNDLHPDSANDPFIADLPIHGTLSAAIQHHLHDMEARFGKSPFGDEGAVDTGFSVSHWTKPLERNHLLAFQMALGVASARAAMEKADMEPKDIKHVNSLGVAVTSPVSPYLAHYIAQALGMRPDTDLRVFSAACDSQWLASNHAIDRWHYDLEARALIVGIETMLALRYPAPPITPGTTNPATLRFFSDKATGFVFRPSRFRLMFEVFKEERDKGGLAGINTLPLFGSQLPPNSIIWQSPLCTNIEMPRPPDDQAGNLKLRLTTATFSRFTKDLIAELIGSGYDKTFATATHAQAHHPSFLIHQHIREALEELGLPAGLLVWGAHYGNSPCCIYADEMARSASTLVPGSRLLQFFFGAGATGGVRMYEIR